MRPASHVVLCYEFQHHKEVEDQSSYTRQDDLLIVLLFLYCSPVVPISSKPSTPVDRMLLLPTGNSSDENDESLNAKLLESQKQVHLVYSMVVDFW